jgi:hypothetical protein
MDGERVGETRNVSTKGAYFVLDKPVPVGSELDLTMSLPTGREAEATVRAAGTAVRSEQVGNKWGVASTIRRHEIIRIETQAPPSL